jgi:hypothetical protein
MIVFGFIYFIKWLEEEHVLVKHLKKGKDRIKKESFLKML